MQVHSEKEQAGQNKLQNAEIKKKNSTRKFNAGAKAVLKGMKRLNTGLILHVIKGGVFSGQDAIIFAWVCLALRWLLKAIGFGLCDSDDYSPAAVCRVLSSTMNGKGEASRSHELHIFLLLTKVSGVFSNRALT